MSPTPLARGSLSLRLYPHAVDPVEVVAELRDQARRAELAGFDGVMIAEHHGGFPGYLPQPTQAAGWALEATRETWAAPCPLLLPLRHWSHVAEELVWLACRFPGRVGAGAATGGLEQDFEMAELAYEDRRGRFPAQLEALTHALRGRAEGPLADDPAVAAAASRPLPVVCAAQGPLGTRRAARLGIGLLFDSLQGPARIRELTDVYREHGGTGALIAVRRAWLGAAPRARVDAQMGFYRSYASDQAQSHWGSDELACAPDGAALAERLLGFCDASGCDALNLRVHLGGIPPELVREQIELLGTELLPQLRPKLAGARP